MKIRAQENGFTLTELVFSVALGAIVLAVAVPAFDEILDRMRLNTAVRHVISDLREARSQAISMGWQYRIVGYDKDSGAFRNQYRMLARRSAGVDWPDEDVAPFEDATRRASAWFDVGAAFGGVELDANGSRFELTFDARGTAPGAAAGFNPLVLTGDNGMQNTVTVSVVGGIEVQ